MGSLRSPGHYFCRLEETVGSPGTPGTSAFVVVTRNLYMITCLWLGPGPLGLAEPAEPSQAAQASPVGSCAVLSLCLEFFNANKIIFQ